MSRPNYSTRSKHQGNSDLASVHKPAMEFYARPNFSCFLGAARPNDNYSAYHLARRTASIHKNKLAIQFRYFCGIQRVSSKVQLTSFSCLWSFGSYSSTVRFVG